MNERTAPIADAVPDEALDAMHASVTTALEVLARLPADQAAVVLAEVAQRLGAIEL